MLLQGHLRGDPVDLNFWMDGSSSWGIGLLCEGHWAMWKWLDSWESDFWEIGWAESVGVELAVHLETGPTFMYCFAATTKV